jgi:hypothetical protein
LHAEHSERSACSLHRCLKHVLLIVSGNGKAGLGNMYFVKRGSE